jgi:hypothetical protein
MQMAWRKRFARVLKCAKSLREIAIYEIPQTTL